MTAPRSAREFEKQLVGLAYSGVGKEPPAKSQSPDVPLVPIYVGIDTDQPPQQLRETFLYRLGDDKWGVRPATSRLLLETGLPGGHPEKTVHDMIQAGLKPYANSSSSSAPLKGAGQMQLVKLQLFARKGDQVFRDEVVWDVGNPINSAQPYAVRVCAALHLGADWFDVIRSHLQQQLDDVRQDLLQAPHEVQLQQSVKRARKTPADSSGASGASGGQVGVPRIEPYDAARDVEAARVVKRQQKLQQRQQAAGVQQQQGQPQQGSQQQPQQQQLPGQHQVGQMPPQQQGQQQLPPQLQAAQQQQQQQQHMQQQQHAHHGQQQARLHHVPPAQVQAHMMQQQQQPQQHVPQQPQR